MKKINAVDLVEGKYYKSISTGNQIKVIRRFGTGIQYTAKRYKDKTFEWTFNPNVWFYEMFKFGR